MTVDEIILTAQTRITPGCSNGSVIQVFHRKVDHFFLRLRDDAFRSAAATEALAQVLS
jgi:hypothetical protein